MNDPRFHIDRDTLIVDGLSRSYRLMHMSDSHMSPDSPLDDEPTRARAAKQRETWMAHGNGLAQEENFRRLVDFGLAHNADLFAFAGDMTDFPSVGTAAAGKALYDTAGRYLYVPGNHEIGKDTDALFAPATNGDPTLQITDLGELCLVGVNNAAHTVDTRVLNALADVLYGDKPVILVHHTPLSTPTLRPDAIAYWQDVTYFLFGEAGQDDNAAAYIRLLTKDRTQLKAVLAGHLHLAHVDRFENGVTQYISAPTLAGYGRLLTVCPA